MRLHEAIGLVIGRKELDPAGLLTCLDPAWIDEALAATGTASVRRRKLPAQLVIWLVLGMALFRPRPLPRVVEALALVMPRSERDDGSVTSGAIALARQRLGPAPVAWLFDRCAAAWAIPSARRADWRDLALFGVDGSSLAVPDSQENRAHFGGASGGKRGPSGYPLVRIVALMALRSHLLVAAKFGPYRTSEQAYAADLWLAVPDNSLVVVDKGFISAALFLALTRGATNRHWLTRAKKGLKWEVIERFGPQDFRVRMKVSDNARRKDPSLPRTWEARVIQYQRKGFQPSWVMTSLLDPKAYPADEVVALYHERWEIELAYDEIKTEMLDRQETLRSKSPTLVEQELWGVLLAYNLIRLEMERTADEAGVPPTRISFAAALCLITDFWHMCTFRSMTPGSIPRHHRYLRQTLMRFVLPPRRPERSYPRAVKVKMSRFPRKRPIPSDGT